MKILAINGSPRKQGNTSNYDSALPKGKTYALVTSQGHPDPERFKRSIKWLAGMTGSGLGAAEVRRIIHADSHIHPGKDNPDLLSAARDIGRKLVQNHD